MARSQQTVLFTGKGDEEYIALQLALAGGQNPRGFQQRRGTGCIVVGAVVRLVGTRGEGRLTTVAQVIIVSAQHDGAGLPLARRQPADDVVHLAGVFDQLRGQADFPGPIEDSFGPGTLDHGHGDARAALRIDPHGRQRRLVLGRAVHRQVGHQQGDGALLAGGKRLVPQVAQAPPQRFVDKRAIFRRIPAYQDDTSPCVDSFVVIDPVFIRYHAPTGEDDRRGRLRRG